MRRRPLTAGSRACRPGVWSFTCLGGADGADGPGGIALLDHNTFDGLRAWETDRDPQFLAYDAWWHLNQNTLITSEWGTPSMIEDGVVPELLLSQRYGHTLHFWDLAAGRHLESVDLGSDLSTRWSSSCDLRTTRMPPGGSSELWSRLRTCPPRCGGCTATGRSRRRTRSSPSPPNPQTLRTFPRLSSPSGPSRR